MRCYEVMLIGDGYAIKGNVEEVKGDKKALKLDGDALKGDVEELKSDEKVPQSHYVRHHILTKRRLRKIEMR